MAESSPSNWRMPPITEASLGELAPGRRRDSPLEVDEMARTRCPSRILLASRAAVHLGDLPARRGRSALFLGRIP